KHLLLSDFRRQMLPAWGALETNEQSPIYRYAKRAYFIIDKDGVIRYEKIQANPLDLLNPDEVLTALKTVKPASRARRPPPSLRSHCCCPSRRQERPTSPR